MLYFFFQAEDGIRDIGVTGVQTCALPIYLQQAIFHRAPVMHHVQGSALTLGGDPLETAAEHSDTVAQKRAVSGIVNVAFHDTGVSAKFTSVRYALLTRQAHHPLINLFGDLRSQQREGSAEGGEIGCDFGVEAGETPIHQVAAEFSLQIAEAPALQV